MKDDVKWRKTQEGRNFAHTEDNDVNLCRYCTEHFATCPSKNIVFGDDDGFDNVCMCASFVYSDKERW